MSTILFETLAPPTPPVPGVGESGMTLNGFGFARGLNAGALGDGELWLQAASDGVAPPAVAFCIGDGAVKLAATYSFGSGVMPPAQGDAVVTVTGRGSAASQVGDGALMLAGFGSELRQPPTTGDDTVRLSAGVKARPQLSSIQTALMHVNLALAAKPRARWRGTRHLQSRAAFGDTLGLILRELLTTTVALGERNHIAAIAVEQMIDALLLGEAVDTELDAVMLIAEAVALGATLNPIRIGSLVSGLVLGASVAETLTATVRWLDELRLQAVLRPSVLRLVVLSDRVKLATAMSERAEAYLVLRDRLSAMVRVHLDSGEYVAWVMNTQSKAVSRYTNYPFNSFLPLAGTVYGATDAGLYRLGGDTDAGEPIHARIRQGMSAFGSQLKKAFPSMYLGYTASGDLRLSVVAADPRTGERSAHAYRLRARAADSVREGRVKVGAGLQSVYFDYVIENIDGADFGLDVIEFLPLRVDRRVRGNSSGRR